MNPWDSTSFDSSVVFDTVDLLIAIDDSTLCGVPNSSPKSLLLLTASVVQPSSLPDCGFYAARTNLKLAR